MLILSEEGKNGILPCTPHTSSYMSLAHAQTKQGNPPTPPPSERRASERSFSLRRRRVFPSPHFFFPAQSPQHVGDGFLPSCHGAPGTPAPAKCMHTPKPHHSFPPHLRIAKDAQGHASSHCANGVPIRGLTFFSHPNPRSTSAPFFFRARMPCLARQPTCGQCA